MKTKKTWDIIHAIVIILISLFGIYIGYQIIRKIVGGSWTTENIIVSLLIFNISLTFTFIFSLVKLMSDHEHLSNQFKCLASDFKFYINNQNK